MPTTAAIAFGLLANLDQYEQILQEAVAAWPAPDFVSQADPLLEAMRAQAVGLPQLSVVWIAFLVSHNQVLQALQRCESAAQRLDALEAHLGKLLDLEGKCLELATLKRSTAKTTADA
jgi:hypothetical protein